MQEAMRNATLPSWQHFWQQATDVVPHVVGSLLVLLVGLVLGVVVYRIARGVLRAAGIDRRAANIGVAGSLEAIGISSTAALLAGILEWFVILSSTIVAMYLLDSRLASGLAERFLLYVPQIAGASLILLGGTIVARFVSRTVLIAAVNRQIGQARLLSDLTRVTVIVTTIAIAAEQAQIGRTTILVAFAILFGGVTLAGAIAVGLALRDVVSRWLLDQADPSQSKRHQDVFQHL